MPGSSDQILKVAGHEIRITHPDKPYFTKGVKLSKLDIARYFVSVAGGALNGIRDRPIVLKRFVNGAEQPPFYQKRAPENLPEFLRTVTLSFPSGNTADEVVVDDAAGLLWVVNLGCLELHPHAVTARDLDHPDELRIDLDPVPGVKWKDVRTVAMEVKQLFDELQMKSWPKTSGSRGIHVNARIQPKWTFAEVRTAALAFSREIERRVPKLATSKWWKEERHGVFLDYNQNAKDRTTCSAYSVRPLPDARVSAPLTWDEVPECEPEDFTVATMPARFKQIGDPHAKMDAAAGSLLGLLELSKLDESRGLADAPWPPHYRKQKGEPARVAPSRAKMSPRGSKATGGSVRPSRMPVITIANSPDKDAALAGLERWKKKHKKILKLLGPEDYLVDSMRGRSSTWTRIRVNLKNVPEKSRPKQGTPDPDDDPTREWRGLSS